MNIGTAIKLLRKEKGLSQKELAEKCDLSANALCQIETDQAFPQKGTIKKICDVLQIPTSYLLFFSISDEDIPAEKRPFFNMIRGSVEKVLLEDVNKPIAG